TAQPYPLSLHDALPIFSAQPPGLHPRERRAATAGTGSGAPDLLGKNVDAGCYLASEPAGARHSRHALPRRDPAADRRPAGTAGRSEEHTSELQSLTNLV